LDYYNFLLKGDIRFNASTESHLIPQTSLVAEILRNRFFLGSEYGKICFSTETFNNTYGTQSNDSSILK